MLIQPKTKLSKKDKALEKDIMVALTKYLGCAAYAEDAAFALNVLCKEIICIATCGRKSADDFTKTIESVIDMLRTNIDIMIKLLPN